MAEIRSEYLIPSTQHLVKKTIEKCFKRFHVSHYPEPSTGLLPVERATQNLPFRINGINYAGPLLHKTKGAKKQRCTHYYLHAVLPELHSSSSYRINLYRSLSIARRGRASVIYSDNTKTFIEASKWISKINKDEKFQEYFIKNLNKMVI